MIDENLVGSGGFTRRLTLVSAPPGFGKTTLVAEWFAQNHSNAAWLTLDSRDNDISRFLTYLVASLRQIIPEVGLNVQDLLQSPQLPEVEPLLISIINEIEMGPSDSDTKNEPFSLVLDDYHVIQSDDVHKAIMYLLEYLPTRLHLLIVSRTDPPFPLARMRGRGQMVEIRSDDLRLNHPQVGYFLMRVMGLDLNQEEITLLANRTEGWLAGLKRIAVALRHADTSSRIEKLRILEGDVHTITDYFFEEVLENLDQDMSEFLLHTSVLDRLSGPVCDELTSRKDSGEKLATLERENLFTSALDVDYKIFRYHPLFADLLRRHLQKTDPKLESLLRRKAIAWYEANDMADLAIELLWLEGDEMRTASLIAESVETILLQGELTTLANWLERLSSETLLSFPVLVAYRALIAILSNQPLNEIQRQLEQVSEITEVGQLSGEQA